MALYMLRSMCEPVPHRSATLWISWAGCRSGLVTEGADGRGGESSTCLGYLGRLGWVVRLAGLFGELCPRHHLETMGDLGSHGSGKYKVDRNIGKT